MSSLFIYNNNVAFALPQEFESMQMGGTYPFQIGKQELMSESFSVDKKIHDILTNEVASIPYDVIFLPYSLSEENYLELIGLRFAYHIRLTPKFNNVQTPVVFYGFEDAITLNKLSELGLILFTKNVYYTDKITLDEFKRQVNFIKNQEREKKIIDPISSERFLKSFVSKIRITPSGNYRNHHSIINEWSIYRWAKALSLEDVVTRKIDNNIDCNLYFKYLKVKNVVDVGENFELEPWDNKGSIFYIDDELDKGWNNIFKFICKSQIYNSFGIEFKNWDAKRIFSETIEKIKEYKPDVIVLDFRLHDDDYEATNITAVSGFKILKEIKENINPGIQVIIFSATNKIWNLQSLQNAGADGFIMKESPELSSDPEYSKTAINKLTSTINDALKMSFLKKVYLKIAEIESLMRDVSNEEESEFHIRLQNNLSIAFKLLVDTKLSAKYFNYAFLQLFQIIEDFSKLSYVFREDSDCYVIVNGLEVCVNKTLSNSWETAISFTDKYKLIAKTLPIIEKRKRLDTNYLVSAILIFRLGYDNSSALNWTDIYTVRNSKAAHFNIEDNLNELEIFTILNFIKNFINPKKQKDTNVEKGLNNKSFEESYELLKKRYQK